MASIFCILKTLKRGNGEVLHNVDNQTESAVAPFSIGGSRCIGGVHRFPKGAAKEQKTQFEIIGHLVSVIIGSTFTNVKAKIEGAHQQGSVICCKYMLWIFN